MAFSSYAGAQSLFDYVTDPLQGNPPTVTGYTPLPSLPTQMPPPLVPTSPVSQLKPLRFSIRCSPARFNGLYSSVLTRPTYTFADIESPTANSDSTTLRNQINTATGGGVVSNSVYVGNFNFYPLLNDPTRPTATVPTTYAASGLNMANEALYPGSPDLRSPAKWQLHRPPIFALRCLFSRSSVNRSWTSSLPHRPQAHSVRHPFQQQRQQRLRYR